MTKLKLSPHYEAEPLFYGDEHSCFNGGVVEIFIASIIKLK